MDEPGAIPGVGGKLGPIGRQAAAVSREELVQAERDLLAARAALFESARRRAAPL
jgi:hypothetical protein